MSLPNLASNASWNDVSQCALVLEDDPIKDSRLSFESFPENGFEEAYSLNGYREIAASRMPQPGFVAYRGGNWSNFSLELKFRARAPIGRQSDLDKLSNSELSGILVEMERKVRWCQALHFPLARKFSGAEINRITRRSKAGGFKTSTLSRVNLDQLERNDPPFVLVVFGSFLTLRCYATGYSIRWDHPFHPVTVQPYGATVTLQFQRLELDYPTYDDIRNRAGSRPQSPNQLTIQGNVNVAPSNALEQEAFIENASANASSGARSSNPGADPATTLALPGVG